VSRGPEVVVITGASAGGGRAAAREFARHSARIGLLARGTDGLEAARREVEDLGSEALVVPTDVANADQVESAAAQIEAEFGQIDIWINNAMTSVFSSIKQMTAAEFQRVTEVTYLGYVYGTLAALKRMLPRDRGVIVEVGSALAYRGIPVASRVLRSQARRPGFLRFAVVRTAPRQQQREGHDGADARAQHAAIWLGQKPFAAQSAAGAADFPAGDRCGSNLFCGAQSSARILYRPAHSESHRCRQNCARFA